MSFSLSFVKKVQLAKNTFAFYFDKRGIDITFIPGQYITLTLPFSATDGLGNTRDFSIASLAPLGNFLSVITRSGGSQFKERLFMLKPRDIVMFSEPRGGFVLDPKVKKHHVFLAGGVGIVPLYYMLRHHMDLDVPMTLFGSFSSLDESIFVDEMVELANSKENIHVIFTRSEVATIDILKPDFPFSAYRKHPLLGRKRNEKNNSTTELSEKIKSGSGFMLENGRISETMIRTYVENIASCIVYVAGSPAMVEAMEILLEKMHVSDVRVEYFSGY